MRSIWDPVGGILKTQARDAIPQVVAPGVRISARLACGTNLLKAASIVSLHLADLSYWSRRMRAWTYRPSTCSPAGGGQRFGQCADMVRTRPAADTQVAHSHGIGGLAELVDFPTCAYKRIQPDRKGARIAAARIGQRHERRLRGRGAIGHRQRGHMALDCRADRLDRGQDGSGPR